MITIKDASFVKSAEKIDQTLEEDVCEVAFIGRSNVGKSSIINALTKRKGLAKSSSTPGKTRLINFFDIKFSNEEEEFLARLVDLPGFGYARVSKSMKHEWQKTLTKFIKERESIKLFVHLVDSRHPNLDIDREVSEYLHEICRADQEILIIFTKADKLKQKDVSALKKIYPNCLTVSSSNGKGIQKVTDEIFSALFGMKLDSVH
ncbi:ribosome biogenesis GTP-binding protein YihA/YsxC [Sulfurospirillum arcachonense]|uniref:ribosome biogenesis GTP-binding protein YihA/YsxC n=1 Tax=Sulfurospirillum arcachonense TaxID=57666 RepID=UPI00046AD64A|nr:ribosome biogenesis GTP-binding protein YihA/YsxC [Sulfurospirillum arcachonense]